MKNHIRQCYRRLLALIFTAVMGMTLCGGSATAVATSSIIKCYTLSSTNVPTFTSSSLRSRSGSVFPEDEIQVLEVTDAYCKIKYKITGTANGYKTAYVPTSAILLGTTGETVTAPERITTYRRPGGAQYGSIYQGDRVKILGNSPQGDYTQVKYPTSQGYKYAVITSADAQKLTAGSRPIADGIYKITTKYSSGGCMTACDDSIQQYPYRGEDSQKYYINHVRDDYYTIRPVSDPTRAIDVYNGQAQEPQRIWLYPTNNTLAQLWKFVSAGNGNYYIQSALGQYCLDVNGGEYHNQGDGAHILLWGLYLDGTYQQWNLTSVSSSQNNQNTQTSPSGLVSPVPNGVKFSKKTNDNGWTGYHDINRNVSTSTPVYAISDGTAYFYQYSSNGLLRSYGNYIRFKSADGVYEVRYAHLSRFNGVATPITKSASFPCSGASQKKLISSRNVSAGEVLGYIGSTGNSSGTHLHIEVYKNGQRIDPTSIFPQLA